MAYSTEMQTAIMEDEANQEEEEEANVPFELPLPMVTNPLDGQTDGVHGPAAAPHNTVYPQGRVVDASGNPTGRPYEVLRGQCSQMTVTCGVRPKTGLTIRQHQ